MDTFDQQILALLRADARFPVSQIARAVNLSRSAVSERVRQLEHSGVNSGYLAQVAVAGKVMIKVYLQLFYSGGRCEHDVELMHVLSACGAAALSAVRPTC